MQRSEVTSIMCHMLQFVGNTSGANMHDPCMSSIQSALYSNPGRDEEVFGEAMLMMGNYLNQQVDAIRADLLMGVREELGGMIMEHRARMDVYIKTFEEEAIEERNIFSHTVQECMDGVLMEAQTQLQRAETILSTASEVQKDA